MRQALLQRLLHRLAAHHLGQVGRRGLAARRRLLAARSAERREAHQGALPPARNLFGDGGAAAFLQTEQSYDVPLPSSASSMSFCEVKFFSGVLSCLKQGRGLWMFSLRYAWNS